MAFEATGLEPKLVDGYYVAKSGINYTNLFFYEKKYFNDDYVETKRTWMQNNWHLSIYYSIVYIVCIFMGRAYMKSRPKYELRTALIAWNFVLAVFSLMGSIRVWPEFISTFRTKGLIHTMCSSDYTHGVNGAWSWLFILSKLPELVDTVFIVLRKQELIFLHWYHHATVLIYCWFSCSEFSGSGRWFVLMNYTVHTAMYSYYGFRAMRFNIPKWVNMAITSGQLLQMVFGIYINCVAFYRKQVGLPCDVSLTNIKWSFIMYLTYFLLFFHFFYQAYVVKTKKSNKINATNGISATKTSTNGHSDSNGINKHKHDYAEEKKRE